MKKVALVLAALVLVSFFGFAQTSKFLGPLPTDAQQALVKQYCAGCHNDKSMSGGFSFTKLDLTHPEQNAPQVEKVILKLRTGMMPPAGRPRPDQATLQSFAASLEDEIDRIAAAHPNPGRPALHRLNRTEYRNSIHDLLDLDIDAESLLPPDNMSHGFDNMSEVLSISPNLMEAYVRAGGKIASLAVGDPTMKPFEDTYRLNTNFSQMRHIEGTPLGTRGGVAIVHNFPADGEYVFRAALVFTRNTFLFGSTMPGEKLEIAVNGERVALIDINPMMKTDDNDLRSPRIKVKAGPQTISASFLKKFDGPVDDFIQRPERSLGDDFSGQVPGLTNPPHLKELGVSGPYNATGVSETPSRRKIFICPPAVDKDEEACARKIVSNLARQAFREPVKDQSLEELMTAYDTGRKQAGFETGIRVALQLMLSHPEFVFRFERRPTGAAPGSIYRIGDLELASRLSYFLWSRGPDDQLITLAGQGKLKDPVILEQQVRRMLKDPRSEALATNFAGQWLYLRNLRDANPDVYIYPDSDENLFNSMRRETELFFDSVVREDRNILDLLTANYTFVDERLAKHYGIPNVLGDTFRRVALNDPNRFGLLGKGSTLTVTALPNRTSPVVRGKWVLEQVLGMSPPAPPPNVPPLKENSVIAGEAVKPRSVRDRLEEHRKNEPCASCHKIMDPIGMSLENFDAVGVWRDQDSSYPVDASGQLVDGTKLNGPTSLREALANRYSEAYIRNFTGKLLMYALGRGLEYFDMPVVRAIDRDVAKDNNRFVSIVMGIVKSTPFQMRTGEPTAATQDPSR